jgi:hypothetical protein
MYMMLTNRTEQVMGQDLTRQIEDAYPNGWFGNSSDPAQIQRAKDFLSRHQHVDFLANNAAAFELLHIFLESLTSANFHRDDLRETKDVLDVCHTFSYALTYAGLEAKKSTKLLSLLNTLSKKLFNTADRLPPHCSDQCNEDKRDFCEIETLVYFSRTEFFTAEIFGLLRQMRNPKEGVIALKILATHNIPLSPAIENLLITTVQPAHVARILHYLNVLNLLDIEYIQKFTDAISRWSAFWISDDVDSDTDEVFYYIAVDSIVHVTEMLQLFSGANTLTSDKIDFLLESGQDNLLKSENLFWLLDHLLERNPSAIELIWNDMVNPATRYSRNYVKSLSDITSVIRAYGQFGLVLFLNPKYDFLGQDNFRERFNLLKNLNERCLDHQTEIKEREVLLPLLLDLFILNPSKTVVEYLEFLLRILPLDNKFAHAESILLLAQSKRGEWKLKRLCDVVYGLHLRDDAEPRRILPRVLSPNNLLFLAHEDFERLFCLIKEIPTHLHFQVWDEIGESLSKNGRVNYEIIAQHLAPMQAARLRVIANEEHKDNIHQIENYLTRIGFLTDLNKEEVSEILGGLDHTQLYTMNFGDKSLASQIVLIPSDVFIQQNVWNRLLACCEASNSKEAFENLLEEIFNSVMDLECNELMDDFSTLVNIIKLAEEEERSYRNKNAISKSIHYKIPDYRILNNFLDFLQNKDSAKATRLLYENPSILTANVVFQKAMNNQLAVSKPFGCDNVAKLHNSLEQYHAEQQQACSVRFAEAKGDDNVFAISK